MFKTKVACTNKCCLHDRDAATSCIRDTGKERETERGEGGGRRGAFNSPTLSRRHHHYYHHTAAISPNLASPVHLSSFQHFKSHPRPATLHVQDGQQPIMGACFPTRGHFATCWPIGRAFEDHLVVEFRSELLFEPWESVIFRPMPAVDVFPSVAHVLDLPSRVSLLELCHLQVLPVSAWKAHS